MTLQTLNVDGMTCGHCVETVTKAVQSLPGIRKVDVSLEKKEVSVEFDENQASVEDIRGSILGVGFEVLDS